MLIGSDGQNTRAKNDVEKERERQNAASQEEDVMPFFNRLQIQYQSVTLQHALINCNCLHSSPLPHFRVRTQCAYSNSYTVGLHRNVSMRYVKKSSQEEDVMPFFNRLQIQYQSVTLQHALIICTVICGKITSYEGMQLTSFRHQIQYNNYRRMNVTVRP